MLNRREVLLRLVAAGSGISLPGLAGAAHAAASTPARLPMARGPFDANWNALSAYAVPEWFRDAKFGLWAHWGPQCQPEYGDWYAREMYIEGSAANRYHVARYGHPSKFGFKDVIATWKAEHWNPRELVALYRKAGARYFVAMANHHDNFDMFDSTYQPQWNALKLGPQKDIMRGWQQAAREQELRFGVSVHASHAWTWYEVARGADKSGPLKGVPYDGHLRAHDGKGRWWEGLDPQALYEQVHPLSEGGPVGDTGKQWNWGNGAARPSQAYCNKFYNRTVELIDKYEPDLVYFDDTALPLWPVSDVGLRIAAHMYNRGIARNGKLDAVVTGKILDQLQRKCMVWDIERGQSNEIEPLPWQTDTCIGNWHYDRRVYDNKAYKSAKTVVHTLIDVVSKNGNLLLNIPVRGDGSIDEQELAVVDEIGRWMAVNGEAIFETRPWKVYGEGPSLEKAKPLSNQGFNEGHDSRFTAGDIRFTTRRGVLYAFVLGWPDNGRVTIRSLGTGTAGDQRVTSVRMVGSDAPLRFAQAADGLQVNLPAERPALPYAFALKIA